MTRFGCRKLRFPRNTAALGNTTQMCLWLYYPHVLFQDFTCHTSTRIWIEKEEERISEFKEWMSDLNMQSFWGQQTFNLTTQGEFNDGPMNGANEFQNVTFLYQERKI